MRGDNQRGYVRQDLLLRIGSDWRIARRKIMLDQSKNLTFSFREDAYDRADIKLSSRARRFGSGADSPRDLRKKRDLPGGTRTCLLPPLAVCRAREPDPKLRRLLRLLDGRGIGHPLP